MLALLIKVVREMVFTLGKWSFSNKPGKFTSYSSQGSNQRLGLQVQRLNSQHTCHWGAARGLFTESASRSTKQGPAPGLDQEQWPCWCQTQGGSWRKQVLSWAKKSSTGQKQWEHSGTYWKRRDMWHRYKFGTMWMTFLNFQFSCTE